MSDLSPTAQVDDELRSALLKTTVKQRNRARYGHGPGKPDGVTGGGGSGGAAGTGSGTGSGGRSQLSVMWDECRGRAENLVRSRLTHHPPPSHPPFPTVPEPQASTTSLLRSAHPTPATPFPPPGPLHVLASDVESVVRSMEPRLKMAERGGLPRKEAEEVKAVWEWLDENGVELFNLASNLKNVYSSKDDDDGAHRDLWGTEEERKVVARDFFKLFHLSSKVTRSHLDVPDLDAATASSETTTQYLRQYTSTAADEQASLVDGNGTVASSRPPVDPATAARARVVFLTTKAELAHKRGSGEAARRCVGQAMEGSMVGSLKERETEPMAHLCHTIGSERVRASAYTEAAQWFRLAHDALCLTEDSGKESKRKKRFRAAVLRSLASALFYSMEDESLKMADECADQAIELEPIFPIFILKLKILNRISGQAGSGGPTDDARLRAEQVARDAMDRCQLASNEDGNNLLSLIHATAKLLPTLSALSLLDRAVTRATKAAGPAGSELVDKIVCAKIQMCSGAGLGEELAETVGGLLRGVTLTSLGRSACMMVLCTAGDKSLNQSQFAEAFAWYELAQTLAGNGQSGTPAEKKTAATLNRKLALAYQKTKRFSLARVAVARAQELEPNSATNFLVMLELNLDMKMTEDGRRPVDRSFFGSRWVVTNVPTLDPWKALHTVKKAATSTFPDPTTKTELLIAMANISYSRHDKRLLAAILQTLVESCEVAEGGTPTGITRDATLALYRCMTRLARQVVTDKEGKVTGCGIGELLKQHSFTLERALVLLKSSVSLPGVGPPPAVDVSWFRRTAWNVVLEAIENQCDPALSLKLAQIAYELSMVDEPATPPHPDTVSQRFALLVTSLESRLEIVRSMIVEEGSTDAATRDEHMTRNLADIERCKEFQTAVPRGFNVLAPLELETLLLVREWDKAVQFLDSCAVEDVTLGTLECMARLTVRSQCPSGIQTTAVKMALEGMIASGDIDVAKFATWFRVLLETALVSNKDQAQGFYLQVRGMLPSLKYPPAELNWLVATAWNVSVEAWSGGDSGSACTWAEIALGFLPFASDAVAAVGMGEKQMRAAYEKMLAERTDDITMDEETDL
ncbi:hypothetical protein HDU93_003791 [Gonapodya sp. JEL0774]|nr:hypothetical protein HDU93_003791 [Gonapodya sp. JEL0774]